MINPQTDMFETPKVLARLHPLEIKRNIFIAGHRLEFLRNPKTEPWKIALATSDGSVFPETSTALSLKDAEQFFSFFGWERMIPMLEKQHAMNRKTLNHPGGTEQSAIMQIIAIDMGTYYRDNRLVEGDYLELQAAGNPKTLYTVRPVYARDIPDDDRRTWISDLDAAVALAAEHLGHPAAPDEFIRTLFKLAPERVRCRPAGSFSEYYNKSTHLAVEMHRNKTWMWPDKDGLLRFFAAQDEAAEEADGSSVREDFAEMLDDMGISLSPTEIEAFIDDSLDKGLSLEDALGRCFAGLETGIYSDEEFDNLLALASEYARETEQERAGRVLTKQAAMLRSSILDVYTPFLLWMRSLGDKIASPEQIMTEDFIQLSATIGSMCEILESLQLGQVSDSAEIEDLQAHINTLKIASTAMMQEIEYNILNARSKKRQARTGSLAAVRTVIRPPAEKIYTFRIELEGIEPVVFRTIEIPGNRTLGDVHSIIQNAFGWENAHLHVWEFRGTRYAEPSDENWEPVADEDSVCLDDLGLRKRSSLSYEYDFGDSWMHRMTVLDTRKASPKDPDTPFCLEAARACPPEDSGGVPGFMDILELLNKPAGKRTPYDNEILDWLPDDYDPAHCDVDEINDRLAQN